MKIRTQIKNELNTLESNFDISLQIFKKCLNKITKKVFSKKYKEKFNKHLR
jgi:hypothetical protein